MNKYEKNLNTGNVSRQTVLKILELLQGESLPYALDILKTVEFVLRSNSFLDYELARSFIESVQTEGD